jgi:hypothetical protein
VPSQDITTGKLLCSLRSLLFIKASFLFLSCPAAWRNLCPLYNKFINGTETA